MHGSRPISEEVGMLLCWDQPAELPLESQVKTPGLDEERLARKLILERKEEPRGSLKTSVLNDLRLPVGNAFGFIAF